jgi:hypothetical protein
VQRDGRTFASVKATHGKCLKKEKPKQKGARFLFFFFEQNNINPSHLSFLNDYYV